MQSVAGKGESLSGAGPSLAIVAGVCTALLAAIAVVYAQTLGFSFVYLDDPRYVLGNPVVPDGLTLRGVAWAFTDSFDGNWFPITWTSHMLDVEIFGVDPAGHHATNVALHAANTLLLLAVLRRLSGDFWPSAFVAMIFALHPIHVESVAWIAERKNLLSTFFGLLAIGAYERFARRREGRWLWASTVLLAFSLMSKPMFVTLPFVVLLLDYWPLRRWPGERVSRLLAEKLPLFALSLVSCLVTLSAQSGAGAMLAGQRLGLLHRVLNAALGYAEYLQRTLWPRDLVALYPHPYLPSAGGVPPTATELLAALVALAAVSAGVWVLRRHRYPVVGWLWFLGTLVPVIGIVQVGQQGFADRYGYVPQVGLCIMAAWGGSDLLRRVRPQAVRTWLAAGGFALGVPLAFAAHAQAAHWREPASPFDRALAVYSGNHFMRLGLAGALRRAGRPDEAAGHYTILLATNPGSSRAENGLGMIFQDRGDNAEAVTHFERALEIDPDNGLVLANLGRSLRALGRNAEALEAFRRALEFRPNSKRLRRDLASLEP